MKWLRAFLVVLAVGVVGCAVYAAGEEILYGNPECIASGNMRFTTAGDVFAMPDADGSSGYVLTTDGAGNLTFQAASGGGGSPGGSDKYVQFNDGGSTFGGDAGMQFDKTTDALTLGESGTTGLLKIKGGTSGTATITVPTAAGTPTITLTTQNRTGLTSLPGSTLPLLISSTGVESTGSLSVAQGGTGATSLTGVLIGNGTSAMTAYNSFTDNHIVRADGTGGVQTSNWVILDTGSDTLYYDNGSTALTSFGPGGPLFVLSSSSGNPFLEGSVYGDATNRFGVNCAGKHEWADGTNAVDTSLERSAAGKLRLGTGNSLVLQGSSSGSCTITPASAAGSAVWTPATVNRTGLTSLPASQQPLLINTDGTETAAQISLTSQVTGILPAANLPTIYGQNTYLMPVGYSDSAAGTRTITSGSTFCCYVGRAPAGIHSCTIYYDFTTGPTAVSTAAIGLCKGTAPDAGAASLTYLGSATLSGGSDLGLGAHKKAVTMTTDAVAGDDIWACLTITDGGVAGVVHAGTADLTQKGGSQSAASDFSAGGGWSAQATTSDAATAGPWFGVRVVW